MVSYYYLLQAFFLTASSASRKAGRPEGYAERGHLRVQEVLDVRLL